MGIHEASSKISEEIQKSKNPYVKVIGDFLLKEVMKNKEATEIITDTDKTIVGSLEAMREVASKNIVKNCAVLTDEEGFNVVCAYYGFERVNSKCAETTSSAVQVVEKAKAKESKVIEFKQKPSKQQKKAENVSGQVSLFDF